MYIKEQSKIIGWDDGPFDFEQEEEVPVVGAITRGGNRLDGVIKTAIEKDGLNGTDRLISAINTSRYREDISLIMLDGITFAGFNVIDIKLLANRTEIPVIAATRKRVNLESFRAALRNLPEFQRRWESVNRAGKIFETSIRGSLIYYQTSSIDHDDAERAISITARHSSTPEPIRLADMIASSFVSGES